ncbi:MAG: hypothetical protein EON54_03465 [Alcaligenaceae bacterium]|nr:MAG: hypothetical protein EON54_03465 [Alcaligenaceae bacterium]
MSTNSPIAFFDAKMLAVSHDIGFSHQGVVLLTNISTRKEFTDAYEQLTKSDLANGPARIILCVDTAYMLQYSSTLLKRKTIGVIFDVPTLACSGKATIASYRRQTLQQLQTPTLAEIPNGVFDAQRYKSYWSRQGICCLPHKERLKTEGISALTSFI